MKKNVIDQPWQQLLPATYDWLRQLPISSVETWGAKSHAVVPVIPKDDSFEIDAPKLSDQHRKQARNAAAAAGWNPAGGAITIIVDGAPLTLVPRSKIKTSDKQLGRQTGLDAAEAIKEYRSEAITLISGQQFAATDMFEGLAAGLYSPNGFKAGAKPSPLAKAVELCGEPISAERISQAKDMAAAAAFTRFLQDAPANYLNPVRFAEIGVDIAKAGGAKSTILDPKQMKAMGMGSYLSVAAGGENEPRMIVIEIAGQDSSKTIALVGKGLTFDSGGISIKPSASMDEMKYDMSGGAAVLGAAHYLMQHKPPTNVVCLIGASENMPSGTATRPGDIVQAMNGKTIEVQNTDAEGRLVLADVLAYTVSKHKPDLIVDAATLTGAVLHGLGCVGTAIMSNDQKSADYVLASAQAVGEPTWQLPLWPELEAEVKGDFSDLKNIAKPNVKAGSIMGGVFLKEFVGETNWVHMDIAGTAWHCQAIGYPKTGGSAHGLRTMVSVCTRYES